MIIADVLRLGHAETRLDIEVLLAHVLSVSRAYLLAFSERELTLQEASAIQALLQRYAEGEPVAYLTGHKEFWSLDFVVTPATLIPRPETELLVELALAKISGENKLVADLGTGSGAIALALAHEQPSWEIHATDASLEALAIAKLNAERFSRKNVIFHYGKWCAALPNKKFDLIVSNPPYIAPHDPHLQQGALRYEPISALMAEENGLQDLRDIISQAKSYLSQAGYLMLEHGFDQGAAVRGLFKIEGYQQISTYKDLAGLERVTLGRVPDAIS